MRTSLRTDFFSSAPPRAIAHRGGGGVRPENTLEAFSGAYRDGARYFELDIHTSRDGVPVVCHDPGLERTTDLTGAIQDLTWAGISRADAGYRFTAGEQFPFRGIGCRIPRLVEVLDLFDDAFFVIEVKQVAPSLTAALDRILTDTSMRHRVLIASEHQKPLDEIRALAPELPTSLSSAEVVAFFGAMMGQMADYRPPADAIQIPPTHGSMVLAGPTSVSAAHRLGLEMHVWTVNEEGQIRELLNAGVDGIISDFPARLLGIISRR